MEVWTAVTAPQATIISGGLTLLAAVFGVVIGWWLFSGRVKDLQGAVNASDKLLIDHKSTVERSLLNISEKVAGLDAQFTITLESLGQLRGNVSDLQSASSPIEEADGGPALNSREKLREDWTAIRDWLEQRAADPAVDGRTRAKYARIDRRRYVELIDDLASDGALGTYAPSYRAAFMIWQKYRNGRQSPTAEDAGKMSNLRQVLAGGH